MTEYIIRCDLKPANCRFYDGAYYTLQCIVVKSQVKMPISRSILILHCIISLLKTSKNADLTTEHIIIRIILLLKASKDADFTTEYIIHRITLLIKAIKNTNFMKRYIIQYIVLLLKASKNSDFTTEHIIHCI